MKGAVLVSVPSVLQKCYRAPTAGSDAYGERQELGRLVASHLDSAGYLAAHHMDSTESFLRGMRGYISTVRSITVIGEVHDGRASAVLCDAATPGGDVRFFIRDGMIDMLNRQDNGQDHIAKGGQ